MSGSQSVLYEDIPFSEDEFRLIADSAPVALWVYDIAGVRSFVNKPYVEFLGVSYEEALAYDWRTTLHPDDSARMIAEVKAGEASLQKFNIAGRNRRHDGSWRWIKATVQPRFDPGGKHIGFVGMWLDETDAVEGELALRNRETELAAFMDQTKAGFARIDLAGRFTLVNDRFCEMVGWTRDELLARTMQSITHADDLPHNLALFEKARSEGTAYSVEKRMLRKDGGVIWVNNSVAVHFSQDRKPMALLGVCVDVTERRARENAIRRNEERLRLAAESAGMASWELDPDTMTGEWSANRFELLGLTPPADLVGTYAQWLECVHPEDRALAVRSTTTALKSREPYTIEYRIVRADNGQVHWLRSHGGRVAGGRYVGVSFDITASKAVEQQIRKSEKRFREIFEQANDFLISLSPDQRITSVNPAVLHALGYSRRQVVGRHVAEFMTKEDYAETEAELLRHFSKRGTGQVKISIRTKDGRPLIWELNFRLTTDGLGRPTGVNAIGRDITKAKRDEAHLRLLIDELNHRVKNTLAIVQGIAQQTFKNHNAGEDARRAFEGRLMALSEAHNLLTREQWGLVSITQIIQDAIAAHGSGRFTLDGPDMPIPPKTAISFALAIHELATNAVKHGALSTPEGRVSIQWSRKQVDGKARLSFIWEEAGGPSVEAPDKRGFGTRMIERGLAAELGGLVHIDFRPTGVLCTVDAPLPEGAE